MTLLESRHDELVPAGLGSAAASFAREALAFLDANASRRQPQVLAWGRGDEGLALFHETTGDAERSEVKAAQAWQAQKWAAGFGWLLGPTGLGGRGLDPSFEQLYRSLEGGFTVPDWSPLRVGLSTVGPGVLASGTTEQARRFSRAIQQGSIVACQLFSEPEAGSDLAAVRTRAQRDGDVWRLEGQKVWTSNAQVADIGLALVRTDPGAPKHRGLTAFVVPMDQGGVDVRPLRQLTGGASFTEVFLDGAVVPESHRIGAVGDGWSVALRTLAAERASTGDRSHVLTARALALLLELAQRSGVRSDPMQRQRLADVAIRLRVAAYHQQRMQAVPAGSLRGPERAIDKLMLADNLRRIGEVAAALLGPRLTADSGAWGTFAWGSWVLGATGYRLGGGSDEVLKTVLGERLLDLPREPS
ncbi:MAG TPA: acyl-CoA dehydrogenase family protein [Acidimicrobiales bacterium]|jgi:acyl-CoA dehydrogenase|nr:acyl-CoA dehydrogenase family protein [Acidimicrobiales bacterium]